MSENSLVLSEELASTPSITSPADETLTPAHWLVFWGCWLGGAFDGMDSNLFSVMLPDALKALMHHPTPEGMAHWGSVISFVFLMGWMLGGLLFGYVGDRWGRVKAMIASILLYSLSTGLAALATDPTQLAAFRFLTGLGIGGELVSIATLLSEVWPERTRALAVGSLLTSYQMGVLLSGVLAKYITDWRLVFIVGALPALSTVFLRLKMEEPEKWQQAQAVLTTEEGQIFFKALWAMLWHDPTLRKRVWVGGGVFGALLIGYWASLVWIPTWVHGLTGVPQDAKAIATIWHGGFAMVGCVLAGPILNRLGRRWGICLGFLACFLASALLFMTHPVFKPSVYWMDGLLGGAIGFTQAGLYIWLPELFPTKVRATGMGITLNMGRVCAALAALNVGVMVMFFHGDYGKAALSFASVYLIGAWIALWGDETRGKPLA
ncbi:MAG: MFS transporter [Vampirovibrionales bacterium]